MRTALGGSKSDWHAKHILRTRWTGVVSGPVVVQAQADLEQLLAVDEVHFWLVDAVTVTSVALDIRAPALALLAMLKTKNIRHVYAAISFAPVRMFASSVMFASGVKMTSYATMAEAVAAATARGQSA